MIREVMTAERTKRAKAWRKIARPEQLAPGTQGAADPRSDWTFWLLLAGRFFGKTRSGAEWAIEQARDRPHSHGALVAPTADDAIKVMLSAGREGLDGMSGILAVSPPDFRPIYEPSKRTITWPNGSVATLYSAEEPNRLRGPQHHWGWVDEIAAWEKEQEAWNQFLFGLRLGTRPQACITTTPRPIPIVKAFLKNPRVAVTRGRSRDNAANVAPTVFAEILDKFEGTRLGRQELEGEILEDAEGALWTGDMIERLRVREAPPMRRTVVAIDPAVSTNEGSDETGIIVFGVAPCRCKSNGHPIEEMHGFVLADLSGKHSPDAWARKAIGAYREHEADRIVAEINNGGALVEANLRTVDRNVPYTGVHAAKAKRPRAEPVAALYEQGKVHHVGGYAKLEDQMCTWEAMTNQRSPDRMDALVWAVTETMLVGGAPSFLYPPGYLTLSAPHEED
jgi:phage terminase large subunit-like protein